MNSNAFPKTTQAKPSSPHSRRILWVDDEIELLKSHILYLESRDYHILQATNGPDALELVKREPIDLVLLDEMMPVMSGLETLRRLKNLRADLPVVMVTKNEAEDLMEEAIGSQIDGYLTKPVNPSQVLSVLKGILDKKQISSAQLARSWAMEFVDLSNLLEQDLDASGWQEFQRKICAWELRLDQQEAADLREMLREIRLEADRRLARWIEAEYPIWLQRDPTQRPALSMDVVDRWLLPALAEKRPTLFLVVDCLRYDQWLALEPLLTDYFDIQRESYFSILPTATPYSRNAIFSGLTPSDLEAIHPELWAHGDEDEASSNRFEHQFLNNLLLRRGIHLKPEARYVKVLEVEEGVEFERRIHDYVKIPLTALVYNFVDILIHTRQSVEVLKEMLPDEAAFRAVTRAWLQHSSLFKILQAYGRSGGTVVLTSDHGSVRGRRGSKIIGDRETSSSLRYKYGRNLQCDSKQAVKVRDPQAWGLPRRGINTDYVFAKEDYFFLYPTNYHQYYERYKDSFQHGGISLDEMILPIVVLHGKK
ncbi:MAG: bifunctional response regulator/alkaline phosphatase family protein [Calditrichota bacterium]